MQKDGASDWSAASGARELKSRSSSNDDLARHFRQPELSLERISLLKDIFEGVATKCASAMREYSPYPATFLVNKIDIEKLWDVLERYEGGLGLVYYARRWDARLVIGVDRRFIFALVDAVYGCEGGEPAYESERPFSALETRLIEVLSRYVTDHLSEAFEAIAPTDFVLERIEPSIEFMMMGQTDYSVIVSQIILQILDRGGQFFVLIPQSALHPFREKLERGGVGRAQAAVDVKWSGQLEAEITASEVVVKASINAGITSLRDVMAFQPGMIIELPADAHGEVQLSLNDSQLAKCELAQSRGRYALRITEFYESTRK